MSHDATLTLGGRVLRLVDLPAFAGDALKRLPVVHRILLENVLRHAGADAPAAAAAILAWLETGTSEAEIPFQPGRVFMHDTTCVPALVDIAAMRATVAEAGGDPAWLNPVLPVDVSVDHSLAVDRFGGAGAMAHNMQREYERNGERYRFMKWATKSLNNVYVHPPGTGIMHTINMERVATVVTTQTHDGDTWAVPDVLIGTDSHTPMVNGLGVLGWGVGGLEAESVMFGMPVMLRLPDVIGVRFTGALREGRMATDLALNVTHRLRQIDLSGRFVEFFGPGVSSLSAGERAVIANMAPEYGASTGYFPVDDQTLRYLERTGRPQEQIELVEAYAKRQALWFDPHATPRYTQTVEIDLDAIEVSLAGPRRPQDQLSAARTVQALGDKLKSGRVRPTDHANDRTAPPDGAVAIAAITSCTNTSEPRLMVAAGLLARKAAALGLRPPAWVKTSFAPGSPSTERYLARAGLLDDLEAVGFGIVGYGCTTCIGNSGPLVPELSEAVKSKDVFPVAVLSGNRNFPGRVHADLEAGFLASPPMVIAFALAGDVDRDILSDPIGHRDGRPIHLADIWPDGHEIDDALKAVDPGDIAPAYDAAEASQAWYDLPAPNTPLFPWDATSTYIRRPPFAAAERDTCVGHFIAHPLLVLGDDMTTDHISPAGQIPPQGEAGQHLTARGEDPLDLNVFASRRGNWEVMMRGMYTNRTLRNLLDPTLPPGHTVHWPSGDRLPVWQAAARYKQDGIANVVIAGERYGMGSSRDWAAKGLGLLNVRAVLAKSFERIHRSNLIGMGILPLRLPDGIDPAQLALRPGDRIAFDVREDSLKPRATLPVRVLRASGSSETFNAVLAVETGLEVDLLRIGGIIPYILARAMRSHQAAH